MKSIFNKIKTITFALLISCFSVMLILACSGNSTPAKFYDVSIDDGINDVVRVKVEDGTLIKDIPNFQTVLEVEGRNFEGWKVDGINVDPETVVVNSNCTIKAHWTVTVTFNSNSGTFADGSTEKPVDVDLDAPIKAPVVTKSAEGSKRFKFVCWSTTKYEEDVESPESYDLTNGSDKHITLYAYFSSEEYFTVKFIDIDENNEEIVKYEFSVKSGETITDSSSIKNPTKSNYKFDGWYTENGSVQFNSLEPVTSDTVYIAKWIPYHKVRIYKNNSGPSYVKQVLDGEKLEALTTSEENISYNHFLYWSQSMATKTDAEAKKVDLENLVITEDLNIYGIYVPQLAGTVISEVYKDSIKVKFYDSKIFTFSDGTVADLSITCTNNNENVPLEINNVEVTKTTYSAYAMYSFDALEPGTYTFTVTNGHETGKKEVTFYVPAAASDLQIKTADTYAKVSWTMAEGWNSYTVDVLNGDEFVTSKTGCSTFAEFYGLDNNIEYTFVVKTDNTDKYASITGTPTVAKKVSDYLLVMYLDGDNDLNDPIFRDMNEVEKGLYSIRESNGVPYNSYASVNVVALWDGWNQKSNYGTSKSAIYELNRDPFLDGSLYNNIDLSKTAPWLTDSNGKQEVDMADKQTLANFLSWVNDRYESEHIILQFSNHGAGPRAITPSIKTPDGKIFRKPEPGLRRAMCSDETNGGKNLLLTKDIPWAIEQSNIGNGKVDMIMEDVCLGGSVEEAYELRNVAKYYLASPNNIPAMGFDYANFMKGFTKANLAAEDGGMVAIGNNVIAQYIDDYSLDADGWSQILDSMIKSDYLTRDDLEDDSNYDWIKTEASLWYTDRATLSLIDLSKMDAVKNTLDVLVDKVLEIKDTDCEVTDAKGNVHNFKALDLVKAGMSMPFDSDDFPMNHIYYMGTFAWLHDCGELMTSIEIVNEEYIKNDQLNELCQKAREKLAEAIISSWADGLGGLYCKDSGTPLDSCNYKKDCYGLTICGEQVAGSFVGNQLEPAHGIKPYFYDTDLTFGRESKWGQLLSVMFGDE